MKHAIFIDLKKIFNKVKDSEGFSQSAVAVIGNLTSTLISAISMILISRNLGPEKFGVFSVGFSIILILNKLNDLGFNMAVLKFIPRIKEQTDQNKIFSYTLKYKLIIATVFIIFGLIFSPQISKLMKFDATVIIYLSFIFNLVTVLYEHQLLILQSLHQFYRASINAIIQSTIKLISAILLLIFFSQNTFFAFVTYMLAPIVPVLFYKKILPKGVKLNILDNFSKQANLINNMAKHSAVGFIALGIVDNVDIIFAQSHVDAYQTGLLSGASRIAMFISLAAFSLGNVLNSRATRYQNINDTISFLKKSIILSIFLLTIYIVSLPITNIIINITIGQQYFESLKIVQLLLGAAFITLITTPFTALMVSFDKQNWYFSITGILQLVIIIIGNYILLPHLGIIGAGYTRILAKLVIFFITICLVIYNINIKKEKIN